MKTKNTEPVTIELPASLESEKASGLTAETILDLVQLLFLQQKREDREEAEKKRLAGL